MRKLLLLFLAMVPVAAAAQHLPEWRALNLPPTFDRETPVDRVLMHPTVPGRLLVFFHGGVMTSADRGATWSVPSSSPAVGWSGRVYVNPAQPGQVFVQEDGSFGDIGFFQLRVDGGRLFRSDDFGESWTTLREAITVADWEGAVIASPFATDPHSPGRIFATRRNVSGCRGGCQFFQPLQDLELLVSDDRGVSWRAYGELPGAFLRRGPIVGPTPGAKERFILAAGDLGNFVSNDQGRTWTAFRAIPDQDEHWIRPDPLRANVFYAAGVRSAALYRSDDGGSTWQRIYTPGPGLGLPLVTIDPVHTERLWLSGVSEGIQYSEDSGRTWVSTGFVADGDPFQASQEGSVPGGVELGAADPDFVYVIWKRRLHRGYIPRDVVAPVVEFTAGDRYWVAADPAEAFSQDFRVAPGNVLRTGASFGVWRSSHAPIGSRGSCRFQGIPEAGQHSRFVTLAGPECDAIKRHRAWKLEGENEFHAFAPDARGACDPRLVPVVRFNNGLPSVNHRYVTDPTIAAEMRARGWIDEGIAFCASPTGGNP